MKEHILHVNIDNNGGNGAFSLVCYLYEYLKENYIFDFFTMDQFVDDKYYRIIKERGGQCFSANLRGNRWLGHAQLSNSFYRFLIDHPYKTVHIHSEMAYKQYLYASAAHKAGVKQIIIHSHSADIDGDHVQLKKFLHNAYKDKVSRLGTNFIACSEAAAAWMFPKYIISNCKYTILHNGINPAKFKFNVTERQSIRNALNIEDNMILLGHVGALKKVKNQLYLLDIMEKLDSKYHLILVGDGNDKAMLLKAATDKGISDRVIFFGMSDNVEQLMQGMDALVFPSYFEGIPMALIEAQATGLPVIVSSAVTSEIRLNDNVSFLHLSDGADVWINTIEEYVIRHIYDQGYVNVRDSDFNIAKSAEVLSKIYTNL